MTSQDGLTRHDPVEGRYERMEVAEHCADILYLLAVAAFAVYVGLALLHIEAKQHAKFVFVLLTVTAVAAGWWVRFALQPEADRARRRLLISDGTGIALTPERQRGYYTSSAAPSQRRVLLNLAENTFFYPRLLRSGFGRQLAMVAGCTLLLLVGLRYGNVEVVELFAVLLLFSELVLGKLVRVGWTISRMRMLHVEIVGTLQNRGQSADELSARTLYLLSEYEYIKARGAGRASGRTFAALNPELTARWDASRPSLERDEG